MFVNSSAIEPLAPLLRALPVETVFDHFGLIAPGTANGALRALQGLLETGKTWVKISGAYRIGDDPNDPRIDPLARALCQANPERIVWGSDWPHTPRHDMLKAGRRGNAVPAHRHARPARSLPRWLQDDALVERVLVTNPAKLYGFI